MICRILRWFIDFTNKDKTAPPVFKKPKYRLVPDSRGTHTLEKWHGDVSLYLCEEVHVTKESADKFIANLERDKIYYREEGNL